LRNPQLKRLNRMKIHLKQHKTLKTPLPMMLLLNRRNPKPRLVRRIRRRRRKSKRKEENERLNFNSMR
jgi:hypothetical protein